MGVMHKEVAAIYRFYRRHKRMPTYREIAVLMGFASKNAAYKLVQKLVREGVLKKDKEGHLIPDRLRAEVILAGVVEAGIPSEAEAAALERLSLDETVVEGKNITYALRVKGDSMEGAGILEGDLVLVECAEEAPADAVVVACIDGEWTLKYLRERNGVRYLAAANPRYPDLYPAESLRIGGVVRAVVRTY